MRLVTLTIGFGTLAKLVSVRDNGEIYWFEFTLCYFRLEI
jgi:hypothetical protein